MDRSQLREGFAVVACALRRCEYAYGGYVYVTALTRMGVVAAIAAKRCGAIGVAIGCRDEREMEIARALGFEGSLCADEAPAALRQRFTHDRGFDYVFETSGIAESYAATLELVKRGASVMVLEKLIQPYSFYVKTAIRSQIRFVGVHSASERDELCAREMLDQMDADAVLEQISAAGVK